MADYDGKIQLAMDVSPEEAIKSFKKLQQQAQKTFNSLSTEKPIKEVEKLEAALSKSVSNGEKLAHKLDEVSKKQVPTDEYKELSKDIEYAEKQIEKLYDKQAKLISAADKNGLAQQYKDAARQAEQWQAVMDKMIAEKGKDAAQTEEFKKAKVTYDALIASMSQMQSQLDAFKAKAKAIQPEIDTQTSLIRDMKQELQEMVNTGKAFTVDSSGIQEAKNALEENNNQLRLQQEAIANLQQQQTEAAAEQAQRVREETAAMADQIAKMLEIKLNAGEIDEGYARIANRIKEIETELQNLYARQEELKKAGAGLGYEEYNRNLAKIRELEQELSNLKQKATDYEVTQSQGLSKIGQEVQYLKSQFQNMGESVKRVYDTIHAGFSKITMVLNKVKQVILSIWNTVKKIGNTIGSIISKIGDKISALGSKLSGLASHFIHTGKHSDNFNFSLKKGIMTVLKYGLGIRSLYVLFRKMRSAISEGLQTLAQMDGGMNQTNAAMSQFISMLNLVKGSLATAFAPILTAAVPMLTSLMQTLANAITYIGMFIAKMTGATSFTKATFKKTNYAASAGGGSSKGKSAQEKYDEAVEKANKKYDKQVKAIDEKNANAAAAAEEKQAKAAEKLAKKQKEANKELAHYDQLNVINIENMEELEDLEDIEPKTYEYPELELPSLEDFMDAAGGGGADSPFGTETVSLEGLEWNWDDIKKKAEELGRGLADKLNKFFKNKDFAKKLGHNIAEALNTALHFVYGFVDQLDWLAMGEWLGTLVQTGIEDFEWDLLGKTIGETLNGIADTIIGFFNDYQVGTLGSSIATMLNNAIETVEPDKLGQALADILKAPIIELNHLLTDTNWQLMAEKLSAFFQKVFTSDELNGETLGQTVGDFVNSLADAIIEFVDGWEVGSLGGSIATFINDAFKTIDSDKVGTAISDTVNMVAGEIKSFFEGLDVGEITDKIAGALNTAVEGINAEDVGGAIKGMLQTAFDFVAQLISKTDFYEMGKKVGEVIKEIFGEKKGDKSLSDSASDMISGIINAGLEFIAGMDISGGIEALKDFIKDTITKSIEKIDTETITHKLFVLIRDALEGLAKMSLSTSNPIYSLIFGNEDLQKFEQLSKKVSELNWQYEHGKIEVADYNRKMEELTGTAGTAKESFSQMKEPIDNVKTSTDAVLESTKAYTSSTPTDLSNTQKSWSDICEPIDNVKAKTDEVKTKTDETKTSITTSTGVMKDNWNGVKTTVEGVTTTITSSTATADKNVKNSETTVLNYNKNAGDSLKDIQTKFGDVTIAFDGMAEMISGSLSDVTGTIDTWYTETVAAYFSIDKWSSMLKEGPVQAINDFFTNDFSSTWETNLTSWWDNKIKVWFVAKKWDEDIFKPLKTNFDTHWKNFITWWDTNMKTWWNDKVKVWFEDSKWNDGVFDPWKSNVESRWEDLMSWWDEQMQAWWDDKVKPWFEQSKWDDEFENINTSADTAFETVETTIKDHIDAAKEAVEDACKKMSEAIDDVLTKLKQAQQGVDGLGSGSGSGGGGGGIDWSNYGGRFGSYMPRLEVMHFEDNLGMSAFKFPELAKGAVIPPNNRFLAVLGDQRSGKNIETPLETMIQAFNQALDSRSSSNHDPIVLQLDSTVIAEAVWDEEEKRYKQGMTGYYLPSFG